MVVRHIKFKGTTKGLKGESTFMIFSKPVSEDRSFLESDLLGSEQHKDNQQEYLEKVIGLDSQAFLNSVLFGQRMKRLIESSNDDKRKLFESLFELDFIAAMRTKANAEYTKTEKEVYTLNTKVDYQDQRVTDLEESIKTQTEINESLEQGKKDRITALENEKTAKEEELKTYKAKKATKEPKAKLYDAKALSKVDELIAEASKSLNTSREESSSFKVSINETVASQFKPKEDKLIADKKAAESKKSKDLEELDAVIKNSKSKLEAKKEADEELEKSQKMYLKSKGEYEQEKTTIENTIAKLRESQNTVLTSCPTCEQKLPESSIKKPIVTGKQIGRAHV